MRNFSRAPAFGTGISNQFYWACSLLRHCKVSNFKTQTASWLWSPGMADDHLRSLNTKYQVTFFVSDYLFFYKPPKIAWPEPEKNIGWSGFILTLSFCNWGVSKQSQIKQAFQSIIAKLKIFLKSLWPYYGLNLPPVCRINVISTTSHHDVVSSNNKPSNSICTPLLTPQKDGNLETAKQYSTQVRRNKDD